MTVLGGTLVALGTVLCLLAALGVLRLPDTLMRSNAATKAASLGLACIFVGVICLDPRVSTTVKMTLAVLLQFGTAPIAGHVIGRAAHRSGVPLWRTPHDDLAEARRTGEPALSGDQQAEGG